MAASKKTTENTDSTVTTKTTAKKKTTGKQNTKKSTSGRDSNGFPKAYMRLRTVLDALEIITLRYCMDVGNERKRTSRAKEIENDLIDIIKDYERKLTALAPGECPDGFYNCGGCCVPYHCPADYSDK